MNRIHFSRIFTSISAGKLRVINRNVSILGKATVDGTSNFISKANLPLHHTFNKVGLTISPIIHGAPRTCPVDDDEKSYIETMMLRAIHVNQSNCIVVYHNYDSMLDSVPSNIGKTWFTSSLPIIFRSGQVNREELVTIAHLGYPKTKTEIIRCYQNACKLCDLEQIDIITIELDEALMRKRIKDHNLDQTIEALDELCASGKLQFYGIKMSFEPYIYHTPGNKVNGKFAQLPITMENTFDDVAKYAEMVIYPISPTTALPTTYPMLDPDKELYDVTLEDEETPESTRQFTRVASDPLTCLRGEAWSEEELKKQLEDHCNQQIEFARRKSESKAKPFDSPDLGMDDEIDLGNVDEKILKGMVEREQMLHGSDYTYSNHGRTEWYLISGLIPEIDQPLGDALNQICPPLASTPRLQDKALRIVLSVGIDIVMLDAELSAMVGKFSLTENDLIDATATDNVFGKFIMPE
eukprot:gene8494-11480_t